ncbi:MAG: four helix bundle protein [Patescibacteria group bacterium]
MDKFNFHNNESVNHPPRGNLPIIQHLIGVYKLWSEYINHFPRTSRYTLGEKIDNLFIELIELVFMAGYASRDQKSVLIKRASDKLDLIKFFIKVAWEIKATDNKKFIALSEKLDAVGKMLGGWLRKLAS